jgi:carboxymethylenebutenolidase
MGADWAVITAANEPDVAVTVLFYGSFKGDFGNMKSAVLGHDAENDEYQTPQRTNSMVETLKAAGVNVTIDTYRWTAH